MTRSYSNYVQSFVCCVYSLLVLSRVILIYVLPYMFICVFFYFCQIFVCHMCFFSFQSNSLILFNWNEKVRTSSLCSNENEIVWTLPSCSNEMNCLNSLISFKFMHLLRITFLFLWSFLICSNDKEIIWNFLFCSNENEIVRILSFCLNLCVCHASVTRYIFISVQLSYLFKWKWKLFELSHLVQMKRKSFGKSVRLLRVILFMHLLRINS